jgi:hypothetical protein
VSWLLETLNVAFEAGVSGVGGVCGAGIATDCGNGGGSISDAVVERGGWADVGTAWGFQGLFLCCVVVDEAVHPAGTMFGNATLSRHSLAVKPGRCGHNEEDATVGVLALLLIAVKLDVLWLRVLLANRLEFERSVLDILLG